MATKKKNLRETTVDSITHDESRVNIPTADAQDLVTDEVSRVTKLLYPRNQDLDPQLVWRGKDDQDNSDFYVDVPPIFIQEKIDPRVLIEGLRASNQREKIQPELSLFDTFDGLDEMQSVEFYQHSSNWSNRMILGDSLQTMASLSERESLRSKVQMIFMDPPYGIKFGSNWQVSMKNRTVGDARTDIAREVEVVKAFRDTWELGIHSYLAFLRDRMLVARDLLTESGSFFMQIGDENVHLVRSLMDEVFGASNFVSLIPFKKSSPLGSTGLAGVVDYLIWYAKDKNVYKYRTLYQDKNIGEGGQYTSVQLPDGTRRSMSAEEKRDPSLLPEGSRPYRTDNLLSAGYTPTCYFDFEFEGKMVKQQKYSWKTNREGMERLIVAGRLQAGRSVPSYVRFHDDKPVSEYSNFWSDTRSAVDMRYVVQTSTTVIERCVLMTTDPGDLVLDPTCGSGTTAFVAEQFGRRWITIDSSRVALAIAKQRLMVAKFPYYLLADSEEGRQKESQISGKRVTGSPVKGDIRQGFVYQRVPHVTLGSIAQNPDIKPGMSRVEIEAVIGRNAETEYLYDKPFEDGKKVRVAGRFTVESLSPHRSLGFVKYVDGIDTGVPEDIGDFNETILRNLEKTGIQNGLKSERLIFDNVENYAGLYVQAIGVQNSGENTTGRMIAIAVGPQYGTVSPSFIKAATREAQLIADVKMLCILGFAFDPAAIGANAEYEVVDDAVGAVARETTLGKLAVVLVRMNTDLLMGEDLKKTGSGNLFVVSGEPDIVVGDADDDSIFVEIKGVDVYDPNTDEIRSRSADDIALWMIDTNYNGESFFVHHCYFPGGQDHYKSLKKALKADIDSEGWETLNSVKSRPFGIPTSGRIAVKVINDYGDEVMKVIEISNK